MDGTGYTSSKDYGFEIHAMAVDQEYGLLFLASKGNSYHLGQSHPIPNNRISHTQFKLSSHTVVVHLSDMPQELKVADDYIFWSSWSTLKNTWSIFRCEKFSGNGLEEFVGSDCTMGPHCPL